MHSMLIILHGVSGSQVHPVEPLPAELAQELFASHVFGLKQMSPAVCERAARVVKYCDGLPLTLEVLPVHPYSVAGHLAHCIAHSFATFVQTGSWFRVWCSSIRTVNVVMLIHSTPAATGYSQVMGAHLPHPTLM